MTGRVAKLRTRFIEAVPSVDIHRAGLITQAYREAAGGPAFFRGAGWLEQDMEIVGHREWDLLALSEQAS